MTLDMIKELFSVIIFPFVAYVLKIFQCNLFSRKISYNREIREDVKSSLWDTEKSRIAISLYKCKSEFFKMFFAESQEKEAKISKTESLVPKRNERGIPKWENCGYDDDDDE